MPALDTKRKKIAEPSDKKDILKITRFLKYEKRVKRNQFLLGLLFLCAGIIAANYLHSKILFSLCLAFGARLLYRLFAWFESIKCPSLTSNSSDAHISISELIKIRQEIRLWRIATIVLLLLGTIWQCAGKANLTQWTLSFAWCIGILFVAALHSIILSFRVVRGYYGLNEYEARQIIQFLLEERRKNRAEGGGPPRQILSDANLSEFEAKLPEIVVSAPIGVMT